MLTKVTVKKKRKKKDDSTEQKKDQLWNQAPYSYAYVKVTSFYYLS